MGGIIAGATYACEKPRFFSMVVRRAAVADDALWTVVCIHGVFRDQCRMRRH